MIAIRFLFLVTMFFAGHAAFAEKLSVNLTGRVCNESGKTLPQAIVSFTSTDEVLGKIVTTTDNNGSFSIKLPKTGNYTLLVSFLGYSNYSKIVVISQPHLDLGIITMKELSIDLSEVKTTGRATRSIHKGDTLQYNASAFKVVKGGNAEDLIAKMPGIVVNNGNVTAQGQAVKKVLLDGKQFFEGDITTALRNIPSEMVSNIQVFDKKSEQAQFSGFDDGQSTKTINVVTNRKSQQAVFGKFIAGAGSNERYQLSGSVSIFNNDRRITLLGMSNNINQQNFSQEDIIGLMPRNNQGGGGNMPPPPGGGITDNLIGQMDGVSKTNAVGMNFSDKWGKKTEVSGNYFFNSTDNRTDKDIFRSYFDDSKGKQTYNENNAKSTFSQNHRMNMKIDYTIDTRNSITFMPRASIQKSNYLTTQSGTMSNHSISQSTNSIRGEGSGDGYNLSGMLLFRHKFEKVGRTLSLAAIGGATNNNKTQYNSSQSISLAGGNIDLQQKAINDQNGYNWGSNLMYTEPLTSNMQMMANYSLDYQNKRAVKSSFDFDPVSQTYTAGIDSLSNKYSSNYTTHKIGTGLRYFTKKINLMAGINYQYALLDGAEVFPELFHTSKNFSSVLPMGFGDISINKYNALRIALFSMSSAPTIQQLQQVIDNSNSLILTTGNPELNQEVSSNLNLRYTHSTLTGKTLIASINFSKKFDYIGESVTLFEQNKHTFQLTKPVNLDGYWSASTSVTYGLPIDLFKSNMNASGEASYTALPGFVNGKNQLTKTISLSPTMVMSSNISENLDFTLSYSAKLNLANNTSLSSNNNKYISQTAGFKLDWVAFAGITLNSQYSWKSYSGLNDGYNQNYSLLTAGLGKKFLRNQAAEIKLQAFDLLHQNKSINRNITTAYLEDVSSNVLKPYWMISVTFDLRSFKVS